MGKYGLTFLDNSGESSTLAIGTGPVNDLTYTTVVGQAAALKTAIAAVSIGTIASERLFAYDNFLSRTRPSAVNAQREMKWLVVSEGATTHKLFRHEVPCADPSLIVDGSDRVVITAAPWIAFCTAWNALAYNVPTSEALTVRYIQFVGRSL